jgi:hypothetical protein
VAITGDSIMLGITDARYGFNRGGAYLRWCETNSIGYVQTAKGSERVSDKVIPTNNYCRTQIEAYATGVVCNYGTNDLTSTTSTTVADPDNQGTNITVAIGSYKGIRANIIANARRHTSMGQLYYHECLAPRTNSSNVWYDLAGQTLELTTGADDGTSATYGETIRRKVNYWLMDTSATGFRAQEGSGLAYGLDYGVRACEVNSAGVSVANLTLAQRLADSGYWKPSDSAVLGTFRGSTATPTGVATVNANIEILDAGITDGSTWIDYVTRWTDGATIKGATIGWGSAGVMGFP